MTRCLDPNIRGISSRFPDMSIRSGQPDPKPGGEHRSQDHGLHHWPVALRADGRTDCGVGRILVRVFRPRRHERGLRDVLRRRRFEGRANSHASRTTIFRSPRIPRAAGWGSALKSAGSSGRMCWRRIASSGTMISSTSPTTITIPAPSGSIPIPASGSFQQLDSGKQRHTTAPTLDLCYSWAEGGVGLPGQLEDRLLRVRVSRKPGESLGRHRQR